MAAAALHIGGHSLPTAARPLWTPLGLGTILCCAIQQSCVEGGGVARTALQIEIVSCVHFSLHLHP